VVWLARISAWTCYESEALGVDDLVNPGDSATHRRGHYSTVVYQNRDDLTLLQRCTSLKSRV
jgi:hypothetical protein